jgi:hypothetical protein
VLASEDNADAAGGERGAAGGARSENAGICSRGWQAGPSPLAGRTAVLQAGVHQWGSAADIYVDPKDMNRMEDLNRDGRIDISDSKYLYDEIEAWLTDKDAQRFQGGMGFYPATSAHPPFVHIDVRGTRARWQG